MKNLSVILFIVMGACSSSTESKELPKEQKNYRMVHDKIIVGKTDDCVYGYWRDGASVLYFCECKYGFHCSVAKN